MSDWLGGNILCVATDGNMKIYIWEGNRISEAYHDDGTLVVLANNPEEARQIIRQMVAEFEYIVANYKGEVVKEKYREWAEKWNFEIKDDSWFFKSSFFDGDDEALNREPDRVEELDKPKWIAFNGGGYD